MSWSQGRNFTKLLGVSEVTLRDFLPVTFLFFSNSSSPMVLCPVNCPAEVHITVISVLRNVKISQVWGGWLTLSCPLDFSVIKRGFVDRYYQLPDR